MTATEGGWRRPFAASAVGIGLLVSLGAIGVALAEGSAVVEATGGVWWIMGPAFLLCGGLIAMPRPRHPIGWLFIVVGFGSALSALLATAALLPTELAIADAWLFALSDTVSTVTTVPLFLALFLFPDGRPVSPRWGRAAWLTAPVAVVGGLAALFLGGWGGDPLQAAMPSPLRDRLGSAGEILSGLFFPMLGVVVILGCASLIVRYRKSRGETRKQLQWIALAAAVLVGVFVTQWVLTGGVNVETGSLSAVAVAVSFVLVPAAAAVAVLRYRLYDIDLVINRAVVVAMLGAFITAVYVGIVAGVGTVVGTRGERDLVLSIIATAVVAVVFQPVRRRVQHLANRLVYGERATPYEVLSRFSRRSTQASSDVLDDVAELLAEGTGAVRAVIRTRVGDELVPDAVWPAEDHGAVARLGLDDEAPAGSLAVPVEHDGELLGMVSITKPAGQPTIDADRELLRRIAGGLGILLRNRRLTADLERRVADLQRSRRRLVATQDETRRKLERDLHDGPQQQLVGLKVEVGLLQRRADALAATNTSELLAQLAGDADAAIDAVRDVARGVYPPLLAEEGIAGAVAAQARKLPIPVTVQAPGLGRHSPDLESAVYFCILEALTNTVKYAEARSAVVTVSEEDTGQLHVTVTDDGVGFDPASATGSGLANIADRVDALDGHVDVRSGPGRGTTIELRVPTAPVVPA